MHTKAGRAAYEDAQKQIRGTKAGIETRTSNMKDIENKLVKLKLEDYEACKLEKACLTEEDELIPRFYRGDELQIKVNKLSFTKSQLPYDYYFLKYCKPKKIHNVAKNLGEVLRGGRIENSVYTRMFFLKFLFDEALNSTTVREHMDQCASRAADLQQKL